MEIRDYQEGDEEKILQLFQETFGRPMRKEYWTWRFRDNPAGEYYIKLMWDSEKLVGHYAVSPFFIENEGLLKKGCLSMTTMTHPDYNGKGIFRLLSDSLYEELFRIYNVEFVMGFPNKNSHYGFIKNLHWKNIGVIHHLTLNTLNLSAENSSRISMVNSFDDSHVQLLQSNNMGKISVYRSLDYLRWRYELNPNNRYYIFELRDHDLIGFLVVKLYVTNTGERNLFIMENGIPFQNIAMLSDFLSYILYFFEGKISTFNTWLSVFDKRHIYYEKQGFELGGKPTYFGVRLLNEGNAKMNSLSDWSYSYGDSDVY